MLILLPAFKRAHLIFLPKQTKHRWSYIFPLIFPIIKYIFYYCLFVLFIEITERLVNNPLYNFLLVNFVTVFKWLFLQRYDNRFELLLSQEWKILSDKAHIGWIKLILLLAHNLLYCKSFYIIDGNYLIFRFEYGLY